MQFQNIDYSQLDNGIHILKIRVNDRAVIREIFTWLDENQTGEGTLRYVLDYRIGFPTLTTMFNEGLAWFKRNPNFRITRTLFVNDNGAVVSMATGLANLLSAQSGSSARWKWRFSNSLKYDDGIAWLLEDK